MSVANKLKALPGHTKITLVVAVVLFVALLIVNQPLKTASAPQGIVSFQLAGTAAHAQGILRSWQAEGIAWAKASLWLDLVFVPAYLLLLVQLTQQLTKDRPGVRERIGARWIYTLFLMAGLSDTAENILLLNNFDPPTDMISLTATILSLAKFTGLILGAAGLVVIRAARRHPLVND
ncbi:MAG TPA: hypothetical protein VL091_04560 [Marinobacter sp.]|nr:hypothetical protein [Marinobacter sp.]